VLSAVNRHINSGAVTAAETETAETA